MMKVLHVIPAIAPRYGGPSAVILGLTSALREAGIDAKIATTSADGGNRLDVGHGVEVLYADVPSFFFRRAFSESYKYSPELSRWLFDHVREYDVVHVHAVFSHSSVAAARACRARRVPYLIRPLGALYPWALQHHRLRKQVFLAVAGSRFLTRAAGMHYTSEDERKNAEERFALPRGYVTSLGVDDAAFDLNGSSGRTGDPYVLFVGRFHVVKRIENLIAAFATAAVDRWRLVIAGQGDASYVETLRDVARTSGLGDRIDFVGWQSGKQKQELIAGASVAALISAQENFGVFAAEAMAAGVPVIVSREVGASADVAACGGGWVVQDTDTAAVLRTAMSDPEARRRRGASAQEWANAHYRWKVVAQSMSDVYRDVLAHTD